MKPSRRPPRGLGCRLPAPLARLLAGLAGGPRLGWRAGAATQTHGRTRGESIFEAFLLLRCHAAGLGTRGARPDRSYDVLCPPPFPLSPLSWPTLWRGGQEYLAGGGEGAAVENEAEFTHGSVRAPRCSAVLRASGSGLPRRRPHYAVVEMTDGESSRGACAGWRGEDCDRTARGWSRPSR